MKSNQDIAHLNVPAPDIGESREWLWQDLEAVIASHPAAATIAPVVVEGMLDFFNGGDDGLKGAPEDCSCDWRRRLEHGGKSQ